MYYVSDGFHLIIVCWTMRSHIRTQLRILCHLQILDWGNNCFIYELRAVYPISFWDVDEHNFYCK